MSAPVASLWRLDARGPEDAAWRTLDTRSPGPDWRARSAEALASPAHLPDAGTCLRAVSPQGVAGPVHVVAASGVVRPLVLPDDARQYLGATGSAAWAADPVAWWREHADGRHLLRVAGAAARSQGSPLHRHVVRAACACAREVLPAWAERYPDDDRPRLAVEIVERWCDGEATLADVREAEAAAWAAEAEAAWAAAEAAAWADADAAAAAAASLALSADHARRLVPLREVLAGLVALPEEDRRG